MEKEPPDTTEDERNLEALTTEQIREAVLQHCLFISGASSIAGLRRDHLTKAYEWLAQSDIPLKDYLLIQRIFSNITARTVIALLEMR